MKVQGASLHYFSDAENSDKYYRAFVLPLDDLGNYKAAYHWGRDASNGQTKVETHRTYFDALRAVQDKVLEKIHKGYQLLGEGDVEVNDSVPLDEISNLLHMKVGRRPLKLPNGFSFVIQEEDCIEDLITR